MPFKRRHAYKRRFKTPARRTTFRRRTVAVRPRAGARRTFARRPAVGVPIESARALIASGAPLSAPLEAAVSAAAASSITGFVRCRNPEGPIAPRYYAHFKWSSDNRSIEQNRASILGFRGSSIYQPFIGAGNAAQFFGNFGNMYLNFRVHASRIKITACNFGDAASYVLTVFPTIVPNAEWGGMGSYVPNSNDAVNTWLVPHKRKIIGGMSTTKDVASLEMFARTKDMFSVPDLSDLSFSGFFPNALVSQAAANPATNWYWGVFLDFPDGSSAAASVLNANVEIDYYVECWNTVRAQDIVSSAADTDVEDAFDMMHVDE